VITRQELYDRKCVSGLINVVEQVPLRASVRGPLPIDDATAGLLLLWSSLRWERTFAIRTLEGLRVDLWSLTRETDEALKACCSRGGEEPVAGTPDRLDSCVRKWLDSAAEQARNLRNGFVGIEHLLLALVAQDTPPIAAIFHCCGVTYAALKEAIVTGLARAAVPALILAEGPDASSAEPFAIAAQAVTAPSVTDKAAGSSWITEIDRPAVGVPRRFGMFIMMLMVTLYALLFSLLKVLHASTSVFVFIALLVTGIGIGQAVLFGGRYPRAASIWIGLVLVPIEMLAFCMFANDFIYFGNMSVGEVLAVVIGIVFVGVPIGAIVGYLFGTVTAGGFYLEDWYDKRRQQQ
jgi:hypothetical protein